ncbi:YitT family protein [Enterococcus raffinosus]|uniref:YitT family protein n=1 Tax=Enterococcus raffinosus TaxID=71452 RepID=UPI00288E79A3|nr:YitT family protein [Enterococcus raffinosus]MDT2531993.1 YitT family protein [Enterococcus raffinosus]
MCQVITINNIFHLSKISIGLLIISISLNLFLLPHNIASTGVGAIGHLLEIHFDFNSIYTVWIINIVMLFLTYLLLERRLFSKVFFGSLAFPIFLNMVPTQQLVKSYFFSLILGSTLFSFGVFCLYKVGSSNGGVTIPPIILERYFSIPTHIGLLMTNLIIIILNFYVLRPIDGVFVGISIMVMSFAMKIFTTIDS